jgi:hypothetical protein
VFEQDNNKDTKLAVGGSDPSPRTTNYEIEEKKKKVGSGDILPRQGRLF